MNTGSIELPLNVTAFAPGDTVAGVARWTVSKQPASGLFNVFWYAEQRDGPHIFPFKSMPLVDCHQQGEFSFAFVVPAGPYSYKGELFELQWALELLIEPGLLDIREKIVIAPEGKIIETNY